MMEDILIEKFKKFISILPHVETHKIKEAQSHSEMENA